MNSVSPQCETMPSNTVTDVRKPDIHDDVWGPDCIIAYCELMREEIAERQKKIVDIPV